MIKHEYTEKNSEENIKPAANASSGNRLHYDARRIASEKNTMKMLDGKLESDVHSPDVVPFETTMDMIAFQPKNKAFSERTGTRNDGSYPRSDVEKNIDEAERYINLIVTQHPEKATSVTPEKTQKPLPSTMEISAFEPKISFEKGSEAPTAVFASATKEADPMANTAATRSFRIGDDADEQTKAFFNGGVTEQTRAFRTGGAEQTSIYRNGNAYTEQTRAFRTGSAPNGRTGTFGAYPGAEKSTEIYDAYSGRMIELTDGVPRENIPDEKKKNSDEHQNIGNTKGPSVRYEYTSPMQNEKIESDMKFYCKNVKFRLAGAVLLAILLFLIENIAPIKEIFPSRFVYIAVDWALAFASIFLIFDRLGNAFKSFFSKTPEVDCVTILAFLFSVAATAVALIFENTENVITLYNFPLATCVFLNLLFVYYRLRRDINSFAVLSSPAEKMAVVLGNSEEEPLSNAERSIHADPSRPIKFGSIKHVDFIDGYFSHGAEVPNAQRSLKIFIPFCLIASLLFFCCSLWVMGYSVPESLGIAYATFMICAPFSVFLDYCYPLYLASRHAKNYNSAILCDKTPDMYRDFSMVVFRDTEAIPSGKAKVKSIRLYGDKKIDHAIYYASSIYSAVGGPLAEVFRNASLNSVSSGNVQIREISSEGVCAMVDGKNIVIGRPAYMEEQCFETMNEPGDDEYDGKTNKRIIYLACEQFIIAKFYIQYSVGTDFLNIAERLFSAGLGISVRTADPCLDDGIFYENKIDPEQHAIRISGSCLEKKAETCIHANRAGIVSVGDVKDLIKALLLCRRLENVRRTNLVLNVVASVFAVAVMALVLFTGNALGMYSVYPALYQLFWILPTYFVSKVYL